MPVPRLTKPPRYLYRVDLRLTQHAYDLYPTVGVEVVLEWTDGVKATVAHWEVPTDDLGSLPDVTKDLTDAFLWGEEGRGVLDIVQHHDRSAQSRRVRKGLPTD